MPSRALHNTLRERVRREVRSSPGLWNEYLRSRGAAWKARVLTMAGRIYVVLSAIFVSICFGSMAAMPVFFCLDPEQAALVVDPPSAALWSLVGLALCLTGCSLYAALYLRELVWSSRDLIVLAYYPISDRSYWRWQVMRLMGGAALAIIVSGIVLGAIAYTSTRLSTVGAWSAVAIFSLLDWVVFTATAMLIAAYIRWPLHDEFVLIGWALPLIFGGCFLAIGGARFGAMPTWVACAIFAVLPSGWAHAAFYFGAIEAVVAAWLFLLPATVVVGLAIRWLTGTFGIREIAFIDGKASIVSLGEARRLTAPRSWVGERQSRTAAARSGVAVVGARSTAAHLPSVLGGLLPLDWARLGWVERLVAPRLSDRQRLLLEFDCPGPPAWTLAWRMSLIPAAISGVLLWWAGARNEKEAEMLIVICNWMAAGVSILHGRCLSARPWYFPVGFRELMKACLAQAVWRGAVGLPVIFGFNLAGTLLGGGSPREAVLRVAACYLVVFAWYLFSSCLAISSSTNDTANRWVFFGWTGIILLLGSLSLVSFLPLGCYQLFSGVAAFLLAWAMSRRYAWMLDHAGIDIVQ